MTEPARIVVSKEDFDRVWEEGVAKVKEWLERPLPTADHATEEQISCAAAFRTEHTERMLWRMKGLLDGSYRGSISTL